MREATILATAVPGAGFLAATACGAVIHPVTVREAIARVAAPCPGAVAA